MSSAIEMPLVLGGHTFIHQLGSDPPTSPEQQTAIVESCLDRGITWIDTTYEPERIALGGMLEQLGRRHEAKIIAWNFFTAFGPGEPVGTSEYYRPGHIDRILEQLRTSYVDCLIVHAGNDPEANRREGHTVTESGLVVVHAGSPGVTVLESPHGHSSPAQRERKAAARGAQSAPIPTSASCAQST